MPWFDDFLKAVSRTLSGFAHPPGRRTVAAFLSAALFLTSFSPAAALASEADSEGEGTAPPGAVEGGPSGGEETVLPEVPGSVAGGGSEDSGEGEPVETEPVREAELPPPTTEEVTAGVEESLPEVEQPPLKEEPSAEPGPAYEPMTAPLVENQPLSAPPSSTNEPEADHEPHAAQIPPEPSPEPEPAVPTEEEPPATQPAAVPVERHETRSGLAGRDFHTVRQGECLWSIAVALLPAGANNAEIAAEVQRLWQLNASRIGTGDPNLLMVGTRLRLP